MLVAASIAISDFRKEAQRAPHYKIIGACVEGGAELAFQGPALMAGMVVSLADPAVLSALHLRYPVGADQRCLERVCKRL